MVLGGKGNAAAVIEGGREAVQDGNVQDVVFQLSKTGDVALQAFVVPGSGMYANYGPTEAPAAGCQPVGQPVRLPLRQPVRRPLGRPLRHPRGQAVGQRLHLGGHRRGHAVGLPVAQRRSLTHRKGPVRSLRTGPFCHPVEPGQGPAAYAVYGSNL